MCTTFLVCKWLQCVKLQSADNVHASIAIDVLSKKKWIICIDRIILSVELEIIDKDKFSENNYFLQIDSSNQFFKSILQFISSISKFLIHFFFFFPFTVDRTQFIKTNYLAREGIALSEQLARNETVIWTLKRQPTRTYNKDGRPTVFLEMERFSNKHGDVVSPFARRKKFHRRKYWMLQLWKIQWQLSNDVLIPVTTGYIGMWRANVQSTQNGLVGV